MNGIRAFKRREAVLGVLAAVVLAAVLAAVARAQFRSAAANSGLAARLLKLDPGARVGGDTIVATRNGERVVGARNRPNFMIALGSGETIAGGNKADQLGALGDNATIYGGAGNDQIHGGPGHDTLYGGAGNDLITDTRGSATIYPGAGENEVNVAGHSGRDRVLCAPGSVDRIYANSGDYIAPSCRKAPGSMVVDHQPPSIKPLSATKNQCLNPGPECAILAAHGTLVGLWAGHALPVSHCPPSHPFLINKRFYESFPLTIRGVSFRATSNYVDWYAPNALYEFPEGGRHNYAIGLDKGGSITNWSLLREDYWMYLHCTADRTKGYCADESRGCV